MAKANRICYTCGKGYYYCPTCPSSDKKESYYNMFCSERCSKIFKILTNETFKHITTAQCKEQLLELNVYTEEALKDSIKNHITRVLGYEEPIVEIINETMISEKVETVVSEQDVTLKTSDNEVIAEENLEKKVQYIPKKNRKKQNSEVD